MKSLPKRVLSAIAAIVLLLLINHFFSTTGLIYFGSALCAIGVWEFQKVVLTRLAVPKIVEFFFLCISLILLAMTQASLTHLLSFWGALIAIYFAMLLWIFRDKAENTKILTVAAMSALGFIYAVLFPSFALKLFMLEDGHYWFLFLISVVAAGDIFAFFGGITLGKTKLMPNVSPNKTVAGAVSGVVGSVIAGLIVSRLWLELTPLAVIIPLCFIAAFLAQSGDLFESLLKRVGDVKDSGHIMPGHGGVLDRLDGIYFAAPVVFAAASLLSS